MRTRSRYIIYICPSLSRPTPIRISFGDRCLNGHCQIVGLNGGNFLRGCDDECWHTVNALPLDKDFCQSFRRTLYSRILSAETSSHIPFLKITTRFASGFQVDRPYPCSSGIMFTTERVDFSSPSIWRSIKKNITPTPKTMIVAP